MDSKAFLAALVLFPLIDSPWLLYNTSRTPSMFAQIQGEPIRMRLWAAIPVYIAMTFLLLQQTSVKGAFLTGLATYAVYDFTNYAVFKNYTLSFALADSLWGGILFALTFAVLKKLDLI